MTGALIPHSSSLKIVYHTMGGLPRAEEPCSIHEPTVSNCHFTQILNPDIRFLIYRQLLDLDPNLVQVIDILHPENNGSGALAPLLSTNHEVRNEICTWLSTNQSWLARTRPMCDRIQLLPTIQNTKYLLKWTSDFDCSPTPSRAMEAWHKFCFHKSTQPVCTNPFPFRFL